MRGDNTSWQNFFSAGYVREVNIKEGVMKKRIAYKSFGRYGVTGSICNKLPVKKPHLIINKQL